MQLAEENKVSSLHNFIFVLNIQLINVLFLQVLNESTKHIRLVSYVMNNSNFLSVKLKLTRNYLIDLIYHFCK